MTERQIMERADNYIRTNVRQQLRDQGHYLTGTLERSIVGTITITAASTVLECTPLTYAWYVEHGVPASQIPFSGTRKGGGGGTSKYIQGLINYFKLRGLGEKEAIRAAFATARKHKKEGMSTRASARFSATGKRNHFVEAVASAIDTRVDEVVMQGYDQMIDDYFTKTGNEEI